MFWKRRPKPIDAGHLVTPTVSKPRHTAFNSLDETAWQAANTRLAMLLRMAVITNVVLLAVVGILASVLNSVYPLVRTEVALVYADDIEDRLLRIEPFDNNPASEAVAIEYTLRRLAQMILPVDTDPEAAQTRLNQAVYFMDSDFIETWNRTWLQSNTYREMITQGISRTIEIEDESVTLLQRVGNRATYVMDYQYTDRRGLDVTKTGRNRLTFRFDLRPREVAPRAKFENLAGLFVFDIAIKELPND